MDPKTIKFAESDHESAIDHSEPAEHGALHDFVRQFPADQRGQVLRRLEELAIEGLESGDMIEMDDAFWESLHAEFEATFGPAE